MLGGLIDKSSLLQLRHVLVHQHAFLYKLALSALFTILAALGISVILFPSSRSLGLAFLLSLCTLTVCALMALGGRRFAPLILASLIYLACCIVFLLVTPHSPPPMTFAPPSSSSSSSPPYPPYYQPSAQDGGGYAVGAAPASMHRTLDSATRPKLLPTRGSAPSPHASNGNGRQTIKVSTSATVSTLLRPPVTTARSGPSTTTNPSPSPSPPAASPPLLHRQASLKQEKCEANPATTCPTQAPVVLLV